MLPAFTTFDHVAMSRAMTAANASGLDPTGSYPSVTQTFQHVGLLQYARKGLIDARDDVLGVRAGAHMPNQKSAA